MNKNLNTFFQRIINPLFAKLLSEDAKNVIEPKIIILAIASFVIHLIAILFVDLGIVEVADPSKLLTNPIAAIYTPFSFILIYEVYLLIYYLPKSITVYIGKQYEIMTLILIRRLFKDLADLQLTPDWFKVQGDLVFTYDLIATIVMFFLIWVFYSLNHQKEEKRSFMTELTPGTSQFVNLKKTIAVILVPIFLGISSYSLFTWAFHSYLSGTVAPEASVNLDGIFFDQFFTILILADVLLLLFSFLRTDRFSIVIRNSGFVISTILIKISFGTEGLMNNVLVVVAVLFGITMLWIHNKFDRLTYST